MRIDERSAGAHQAFAQSLGADALRRNARAFEQKQQIVRQHLRVAQAGRAGEGGEALAMRCLVRLDNASCRMLLLREFDRRVRQRAAALIAVAGVIGHSLEPPAKLSQRIVWEFLLKMSLGNDVIALRDPGIDLSERNASFPQPAPEVDAPAVTGATRPIR